MARRIAFVVPRYGTHILGGAETLVRTFAEKLAARGDALTIFATCIRSYETWANEDAPGQSVLNGVNVNRYPIAPGWKTARHDELWQRMTALAVDEQYEWVHRLPQSPDLYRALSRAAADFDLIFFAPYLRSSTYYGALLSLKTAVMWPCLHDEVYAHLHPTRVTLECARGLAYNTESERRLAHRLGVRHPREFVIGAGIELEVEPTPAYQLPVDGPTLMYAGRMEGAKNYDLLTDYFVRYKAKHGGDLKLIVCGSGPLEVIRHPDIVQLGFLSRPDLLAAMRAATVFCQPSVNESFSYVIMEAWLAGTPVLVHRHCAVTHEHVANGQGGLVFGDYDEFEMALFQLLNRPTERDAMAAAGRTYVEVQYNWNAVLERFDAAFSTWTH